MKAHKNYKNQGNRLMITVSVVVPTYRRPDYLERCVRSVCAQSLLPDELILVSRDTDATTNEKITALRDEFGKTVSIRNPHVTEAGFLPPIKKGIETASMDIVAFLDDDCEALPGWMEKLAGHYASPLIGGVGGRYINISNGGVMEYKPASTVGRLYWFGRSVGNMYKETTFAHPVQVDSFIGGNMSFRRDLLHKIIIDPALNANVAFHWELDVAQQIKKLGVTLLFDPGIKVKHYGAPRDIAGLRSINYDGIYYSNFNYAYLMMKHLNPFGKIGYFFYTFIVGSQHSTGLIHLAVQTARRRPIHWRDDVLASVRGRLSGLKQYWFRYQGLV